MARYKKASVEENLATGVLTWKFTNGKTVVLDVDSLNDDIKRRGMFHGFQQKGSDCYAGEPDADSAYEKCAKVVGLLRVGQWSAEREGASPTVSMIDEAIERFIVAKYPEDKWPVAREKAALPDVRDKLKTSKEVIALVETIRQERAAKKAAAATESAEELLAV